MKVEFEVQRYIDSPPRCFTWRSYMTHIVIGRRDWWKGFSIPTGRK